MGHNFADNNLKKGPQSSLSKSTDIKYTLGQMGQRVYVHLWLNAEEKQ